MELVSKDGQEEHLGISCSQDMLAQVIEIPPRTVLLKLMEANGAKGPPIFTCIASESLHFKKLKGQIYTSLIHANEQLILDTVILINA
ncbi:unnamed protein product [Miscanthus lutarioriparius]|uniref:Uncharacterized protein n=1 Tax=Miscanthus lutarioriparius TaxID=422564 RepID=A0A811R8U6_9POAL|nr:unnamed protein product [Miscanthus lutarioriparius]